MVSDGGGIEDNWSGFFDIHYVIQFLRRDQGLKTFVLPDSRFYCLIYFMEGF